eukprot:189523-Prorocentrum_minimum.AAC.1
MTYESNLHLPVLRWDVPSVYCDCEHAPSSCGLGGVDSCGLDGVGSCGLGGVGSRGLGGVGSRALGGVAPVVSTSAEVGLSVLSIFLTVLVHSQASPLINTKGGGVPHSHSSQRNLSRY